MERLNDLFKEKANFEINMKCQDGRAMTKISGNNISLLAGLATLIEHLHESGISKKDLEDAVKMGLKSKEEKEAEIKNKLDEILNSFLK